MPSGALDRGEWGPAAKVRPDDALRDALLERQRAGPIEGSISVTEVLEPRPSYWRRVQPVPPSAERSARMRAGQEMHVLAGHLLAPASAREVRRRRDGIVARIDLLDDRVTELKTTSLRAAPDGAGVRPTYWQQLAVYCGLVDGTQGRLVLIDPHAEGSPRVEAYDLEFPDAAEARNEAVRRAALLREAFRRRTTAGLPRCAWRDRSCEFQEAGVCDCTGGEAPSAPDAFGPSPPLVPNPAVAERLRAALAAQPPSPAVRRFRDLLYPRRAYFERTVPLQDGDRAWTPPAGDRSEDLWRQISDLLETGVAGEMAAVDPLEGGPLERVTTLGGRPMVLKTNRSWNPPSIERIVSDQPQYVLELALRCAAVGESRGILIVGYERIPAWERRLKAYGVTFDPPSVLASLWAERTRSLRRALEAGTPGGLPTCPGWMYEGCPYRADCACSGGAGPGVDQR